MSDKTIFQGGAPGDDIFDVGTWKNYRKYVRGCMNVSKNTEKVNFSESIEMNNLQTVQNMMLKGLKVRGDLFETYRQNQIDEGMQYPMNLTKWQGSQVVTYGDFVVFIMLGGYLDTPMNDEAVTDDTTTTDDTTVTDDTPVDATDSSADTASDFS